MPTGCEFPMIKTFENALTAADFESTVELTNFPAVFRGCASVWDAYSKWNPFNSGLDYLEERAGSVEVEADLNPMCEDYRPGQIYLAQFPILNDEKEEKVLLKILRQDIQTPTFLDAKSLSSINFWMNSAEARSSTHYDPHHNLLCVVSGRKKVVLWPPSASPSFYHRIGFLHFCMANSGGSF